MTTQAPSRARRTWIHRPWAVGLALLVAVFAALAPTVSHALWQGHARQGFTVCSTQGERWVAGESTPYSLSPSSTPSAPDGPDGAFALVHCAFCLHTADHIAPPPGSIAHLFLAREGQQGDAVSQAFFFLPEFFLPAAPRGPPAPV